jgi:DNA adenine methylase
MSLAPANQHRYVEPFAGSAALFFALHPSSAILGDFNAELINALAVIRDNPRKLHRAVADIHTDSCTYYQIRDEPAPESSFRSAVRFVYLNRNCFNGLYRTNRAGVFNVPYGSNTGGLPSSAEFYRCSIALRSARLIPLPFRETLQIVEAGDFVYVDPPYMSERPTYGEYGYGAFSPADVEDLCDLLIRADALGARVVLSYTEDPRVTSRLDGWYSASVPVRRSVAGRATKRSTVRELLIWNYATPETLAPQGARCASL